MKFPKEVLDDLGTHISKFTSDGDLEVDPKDIDDVVQYAEWAHARITELEAQMTEQNRMLRTMQAIHAAVVKLLS